MDVVLQGCVLPPCSFGGSYLLLVFNAQFHIRVSNVDIRFEAIRIKQGMGS